MTTIHAGRGDLASRPRSLRIPGAAGTAVPDHVPAELAAEHPDAAAVVAGQTVDGRRRNDTSEFARRELRRSRLRWALAFSTCAALAAFNSGSLATVPSAVPAGPVTDAVVSGGSVTQPQPDPDCPPGTSVVVRCGPPCPTLVPLEFPLTACTRS